MKHGYDLTAAFIKHGILRISDTSTAKNGSSFAVFITGDICGTGKTIGQALDCALRDRALQNEGKAA